MNNREFAYQSKKITINDAAAQKKGEAASSIEYRIGVQKPAPKQLKICGRQKFFFAILKNICLAYKKSIVLIYKHINSSNNKSEDISVTRLGRFKFLRL